MTAIRTEPPSADRSGSEESGRGKHAAGRNGPEEFVDANQVAAAAIEGEIREFVRRDVAAPRLQPSEVNAVADPAVESLNALVQRVAGASIGEIDRVIDELQGVRDMLRNEGDRVNRELAGYASLSRASMTAMRVIADSIKQWKSLPPESRRS
jgi:hypothetical protein